MTTLYKITQEDLTTYRGFQYERGTATPRLSGPAELCGSNVYHAYRSPQLALLLNPIHGNYKMPFKLWRADGEIVVKEHELKVGVRSLTLREEISFPVVTIEQRVTFAITCALAVTSSSSSSFCAWAEEWLSGEDRGARVAAAAAEAAWRGKAEAAAWAAEAVSAARAAQAAAWAAEAAAWAAWAAARVAAEARDLSLIDLGASALLPWEGK